MSTETVAAETAPSVAPASAPAAPSTSWEDFKITDEQFKAAGFTEADLKEAGTEVKPASTPAVAPAPSAPPAVAPAVDETALNLDALKDPETPAPATPSQPQLSNDQLAVLKFFPNADIAAMGAQGLTVTNAYAKGDVPGFLAALQNVNPQAFTHLQEQLYQSLMPGWVDRYIAENDPNANPGQTALQRRLETLERERAAEKQAATNWQQQQQHQQRLQAVDGEVKRLFDVVKFTDANGFDDKDREFVLNAIRVDLAGNRQVLEQAWGGNLAALRPLFRDKVNQYVQRDRARAEKLRATAQTQQQDKRPPVQAAGVGTTTTANKGKDAYYESAAAFVREHATT